MNDELAIQQTINRYAVGAGRGDWDQVLATYVPDAVWELAVAGMTFAGLEAIRGGLLHFAGTKDYIVQVNAPAVIEVAGDKATAHSVIRECGKYAGRDEALEVLGFYVDTLVRTADGWKFSKRVFHEQGRHTFPLLPASRPSS